MLKEVPIYISEPEVEVIAERRKSRRRQRFDRIPSKVEGVQLIVEPGTSPEFTKREVTSLQAGTDRIESGKKAKAQADIAREIQIDTAKNSGFRGLSSGRGNYEVTIIPNDKPVYDSDLLEQSTGEFHKELVREEGHVEIDLPFGSEADSREELEFFTNAVARILVEMGRDPEEVEALIRIGLKQRLDEERLDQLIRDNQIELLPGTKKIETIWSVKTTAIEKATTPKRQRKLKDKK